MTIRCVLRPLLLALVIPLAAAAQIPETNAPAELLGKALTRLAGILEPGTGGVFTVKLKLVSAEGVGSDFVGREVDLAVRAPDRLRVAAEYDGQKVTVGRDGEDVWVQVPGKKFGVLGRPGIARFGTNSPTVDDAPIGPLKWPVTTAQVMVVPMLSEVAGLPDDAVDGVACRVIKATPKPEAIALLHLPKLTLQLWLRESDSFPLRIDYRQAGGPTVRLELKDPGYQKDWPAENWRMKADPAGRQEVVARSHLVRFMDVLAKKLTDKELPVLGEATGARQVVAREGAGRLEKVDETQVLVLKGTPEEMGRQHGVLMRKGIHDLVDRIVYGVGVGSSFEKGRWFFDEVAEAQRRTGPHVNPRHLREMDAMADAAGLEHIEMRLANFFPELFHCSGFAVFGKATEGGRMYHGRILDYLRGMGLEQNAAVIVVQPDKGNAWVNIGYAGFVGSVTAMNAKHVAIGEMGGRGEGDWDGKPMAQLVREVMEQADTLDQAVDIMRRSPRTCEYYYVISDSKTKQAVGIAATPGKFEVIRPGHAHPQLPHAIEDAVLMSAGDRYQELAKRVREGYGRFDAPKSRDLMKRPVCMTSNIHSVLFEPETLDFWVANADSKSPAAHTRYTRYNLAELLKPDDAGTGAAGK